MQCEDTLCRSILFPKSFNSGVFDIEALLRLQNVGNDHAMSLASMYLLRTELNAHRYGCRTAETGNARFLETQGRPPGADEMVHYLGFYETMYCKVLAIELECYDLSVRWKPENGEDAHFELKLEPRPAQFSEKQKKRDRRTARTLLALTLSGPKRHVCGIDEAQGELLNAIELPQMPEPITASLP